MPRLFGVDIAAEINRGLGPGLLDAELVKVITGTRTSGSLTAGTNPTTTTHAAKGFLENYKDFQVDGTVVRRGDRIVVLLGASIADAQIPTAGDRVCIEDEDFNIVNVERDPAAATYTCQVRS